VESKLSFVALLRKVGALAAFGFLAIVLAGPVLSVLIVVLTFAVIGFLLWLPVRPLLRRRDGQWRDGVQQAAVCAHRGAELLGVAWSGAVRRGREAHGALRSTVSVVGSVLLETLSGAVVGILLVTTCWPQQAHASAVPLAALAGILVGVLVVASRARPAPDGAEQSPEGVN
jgi:hypothetical protein